MASELLAPDARAVGRTQPAARHPRGAGWVRIHAWAGVEIDGMPNLERWIETIAARPAVQRGVVVPGEVDPEAQRRWIERFRAGEV